MATENEIHAAAVTRGALEGIEASVQEPSDVSPTLLLTPLACFGDAMRLSLPVPSRVRDWLASFDRPALEAAANALKHDVEAWTVGESRVDGSLLGDLVLRRDQAQSIRVALVRLALPRAAALAFLEPLETALAAVDERLSLLVSREQIATLLETRVAFVPSWADGFVGAAGEETGSGGQLPDLSGERLPPDVIVSYLVRGTMRAAVEGRASRDHKFAAELADAIAAAIDDGDTVCSDARRWLEVHRGANVIRVTFGQRSTSVVRAAADDHAPLWDIAADGTLLLDEGGLTVRVKEHVVEDGSEVALRFEAKAGLGIDLRPEGVVEVTDGNGVVRSGVLSVEASPLYRLMTFAGDGVFQIVVHLPKQTLRASVQVRRDNI